MERMEIETVKFAEFLEKFDDIDDSSKIDTRFFCFNIRDNIRNEPYSQNIERINNLSSEEITRVKLRKKKIYLEDCQRNFLEISILKSEV